MVNAPFLLLPFFLVMLLALCTRNGKNAWLGYAGALAGLVTASLPWTASDVSFTWLPGFAFGTLTDLLSTIMVVVVSGIGSLVFLYSTRYFGPGEDLRRYYALLALFAWSMLGVVLARNALLLLMCWELVGVSSFLLIGFWHRTEDVVRAARKAFLTILVGDILFLLAILLLFIEYGTLDIPTILAGLVPSGLTLLAGIGIIGGAMSKSAQFPFHNWLADAMAGPTPVSAFLHSATMVKAGLYLVARFLPLLVIAGLTPWLLAIATLTLLFSAAVALVEYDVKRVLAYSTMNQLAFILIALSLGAVAAGMFHLVIHSIFKALLFFVAGIAIHAAGTQDLRQMRRKRGWSLLSVAALVGVLALAGVPPLAGFASKEMILHEVLHADPFLIGIFCVAIVLSAAYITRWWLLLFSPEGTAAHAPWQQRLPLWLLGAGCVIGGTLLVPFFGAWGVPAPSLLSAASVLSTLLVCAGAALAWHVHRGGMAWLPRSTIAIAARARFLVDEGYAWLAGRCTALAARAMELENTLFNHVVRRMAASCAMLGARLRTLQTGVVHASIAAILLGFVLLVAGVLL